MSNIKLTQDKIDDLVDTYEFLYSTLAPSLTVCVVRLKNGGVITGQSIPIDPANFDPMLGRKFSLKDAKDKLWQLEGYAMKREMAD